ncbi:MAG TPA: GMC family oxidoreductase [Puia sp.]|nr:GMC family oxidoreductase [Puia sp.]
MHIDARHLPDNTLIEGDICIVGTGPAGLSIALQWDHTPYKVILLEGGGLDYDDQVQDLYAGQVTGQKYYPLRSTRLHYFGGTSNHWSGYCSPYDPLDFKWRSWVPHSGWPIDRSDLDPYYAKAQSILDLGPYEYDVAYWQKRDPELISLLPANPSVWNKVWQFSPPTRLAKKYGPQIMASKNIHLYTYANLIDITANENLSTIKDITVKNEAGKTHTVRAKRFILACSTIQNARILLSCNKQAPNGLGNDHDLVGRYFMEHLQIKSAWLFLPTPDRLKLYSIEPGVTKMRCELAITPAMQEKYGILSGTASLLPFGIAQNAKASIDTWNNTDPRQSLSNFRSSNATARHSATQTGNAGSNRYMLSTRIEQAPNPNSRITLSREKDALGMPRSILHWELTPFEKRSVRTMYELIGQEVGRAGVARLQLMEHLQDPGDYSWPEFTSGGWHHMGTTRMGNDPATSVVDADCKLHGVDNLFIAGASCFVTAAAPNPTLTIVALSLRLSDHLKKQFG